MAFGDGLPKATVSYDLMRFAFRRGEDFLASRVARRNNPDMPDQTLYNKLKDRKTGIADGGELRMVY